MTAPPEPAFFLSATASLMANGFSYVTKHSSRSLAAGLRVMETRSGIHSLLACCHIEKMEEEVKSIYGEKRLVLKIMEEKIEMV